MSRDEAVSPYLHGAAVFEGGPGAEELLLVDATGEPDAYLQLALEVADAWRSSRPAALRAWIVLAISRSAVDAVRDYYDWTSRRGDDRDDGVEDVREVIPVGRLALTEVSFEHKEALDRDALLTVASDPPTYQGPLLDECVRRFRRLGVACADPWIDDEVLYKEVQYATGETGSEQVLAWDDIYSQDELYFMERNERIQLTMSRALMGVDQSTMRSLACVTGDTRFAIQNQDL